MKNTHEIVRGFAFEDEDGTNQQYKKGSQANLTGKTKDFAESNDCAVVIKASKKKS